MRDLLRPLRLLLSGLLIVLLGSARWLCSIGIAFVGVMMGMLEPR